MAIVTKPMISNLVLTIDKDVANAIVTVDFDILWSKFDQLTNLAYGEVWKLVGIDGLVQTTLFVGPSLVNGVSSNGNITTHRTKVATIPLIELDEDSASDDDIAAVVTLDTPAADHPDGTERHGPRLGPVTRVPANCRPWSSHDHRRQGRRPFDPCRTCAP